MQTIQTDKKLHFYFGGILCLGLMAYDDFIFRSFTVEPRIAAINPIWGYFFLAQGVTMILMSWLWNKVQTSKGTAPLYARCVYSEN